MNFIYQQPMCTIFNAQLRCLVSQAKAMILLIAIACYTV